MWMTAISRLMACCSRAARHMVSHTMEMTLVALSVI
jgi:hypothetical protein